MELFHMSLKKYLLLGMVCVGQAAFARWWFNGDPSWMILAAAFSGVVFFTPMLIDVVPALVDAQRQRAQEGLQGVHYMFDDTKVRVLYSGGQVWLPTADVHAALRLKLRREDLRRLQMGSRHRIIPGTKIIGIPEKHLRSFVLGTRAPEAQRFALWFEREVQKPIHNRVARGMHVPEAVDEEG